MLSLKFIPGNLSSFLEFFNQSILDVIPNPFESTVYLDYNCPVEKKWIYFQDGGTCGFFKESGIQFTLFSVLLLLKLAIRPFASKPNIQNKNKSKDAELNESQQDLKKKEEEGSTEDKPMSLIDKVNAYLSPTFFIFLMRAMIYDLFLPSLLNIRFGLPNSKVISIISFLVSIASVTIVIGLTVFVIKLLLKMEKSKNDKIESTHLKYIYKDWLELRENMAEKISRLRSFTPEIMMVTDILTCFSLVLFYKWGIAQVLPIILLKGLIIYLVCKQVFKSKIEWAITVVNETGVMVCLTGLAINEMLGRSMSLKGRHNVFGWGLIISILLTILFNLLIAMAELYGSVKTMCGMKNKASIHQKSQLKNVLKKRTQQAKERREKIKINKIDKKPVLPTKEKEIESLKEFSKQNSFGVKSRKMKRKKKNRSKFKKKPLEE